MNISTALHMMASLEPDRVALDRLDGGLTYGQLLVAADAGAAMLCDRRATRLVYLAAYTNAYPIAVYAAALAKIPIVPLNYRLGRGQLDALLEEQGDSFVAVVPDAEAGSRLGLPATCVVPEWELLALPRSGDASSVEVSEGDPEAVAVYLYTSGTTAKPKAVVLRHRHLISYVTGSTDFASASSEQAALVCVPPYHIAGLSSVLTNIFIGRRITTLPQFDAEAWLRIVSEEHVTHALVVPTMLARVVSYLEETSGSSRFDASSLRVLSYGGARMPVSVLERALSAFPGVDFVNAYGLTETSSTITVLTPDDHRAAMASADPAVSRRLQSVGRPLPGVEVQIRRDGVPAEAGVTGAILVRGPQVSGEYAGAGSRSDDEGWFDTRDEGWFDAEGYLFVAGRSDDTIIRGGENVSPVEIEDVLLQHPAILDAAVVGLPDDEWGQRIAATVTVRPGAEIAVDELREFCRASLRSSKTPDDVLVVGQLPMTATGKVVRREIVELFVDNAARSAVGR